MNKSTDYNTRINNPNLDELVASVIFSISSSDAFDSIVTTSMDVRFNNQVDYKKIFEQKIKKNYVKRDGHIYIEEVETLPVCNLLDDDSIKCIISFISYNKRALTIFKDYLSKFNKDILIENKLEYDIDEISSNDFNFEEYVDKYEDSSNNKISGFISIQYKKDEKFEKIIKVKNNNIWETIYYCIYYKSNDDVIVENELVKNLDENEIQLIKKYINKNGRCIEDIDLYLKRVDEALKSKKY